MYYKKSLDIENAYAVSDIKYDDDYIEMDDNLFEQDELGDYYLKIFLKNPSSEYIKRLQKYKDLLELFSNKHVGICFISSKLMYFKEINIAFFIDS